MKSIGLSLPEIPHATYRHLTYGEGNQAGELRYYSQEMCPLLLGYSIGIISQRPQRLPLYHCLTGLLDLIRNKKVASDQVVSQNREMKKNAASFEINFSDISRGLHSCF